MTTVTAAMTATAMPICRISLRLRAPDGGSGSRSAAWKTAVSPARGGTA
ncbi:hypothetical protein [Nonomuraea salmonea]